MIGDWSVPSIERIATLEGRRTARLPVPGLRGDLQQDLGAASLVVEICGSLHGDTARDEFLAALREPFYEGEPVTFVADITTATELEEVLIEALHVEERNDAADAFRYRITLRQYVEPPEPPGLLDDLGADLLGDLEDLAALGLDGLELPALLADLPSVADPLPPLQGALAGVEAAVSGLGSLLDGLRQRFEG